MSKAKQPKASCRHRNRRWRWSNSSRRWRRSEQNWLRWEDLLTAPEWIVSYSFNNPLELVHTQTLEVEIVLDVCNDQIDHRVAGHFGNIQRRTDFLQSLLAVIRAASKNCALINYSAVARSNFFRCWTVSSYRLEPSWDRTNSAIINARLH